MRISDWSSDVCSSDLAPRLGIVVRDRVEAHARLGRAPVDPHHPEHQFARLEPEASEAIDEARDGTDVVGAEIGEAFGVRRLGGRIEGAQGEAVEQDRKSGVKGKGGAVRVGHGGGRTLKTKKKE